MTIFLFVGSEQHREWFDHLIKDRDRLIAAREAFEHEDYEDAHALLEPLVTAGNAEAMYRAALFSKAAETEQEFEKRHLMLMEKSAIAGFPPALYSWGAYLDRGDYFAGDIIKAAQCFKRAAELGHAHSQWIYGENLLQGTDGIPKDEKLGLEYIFLAADAKFEGALETVAELYEKGLWGYPQNAAVAAAWRAKKNDADVITY